MGEFREVLGNIAYWNTHIQRKERELEVTSLHVTTFESWRQNNLELRPIFAIQQVQGQSELWKTLSRRGRRCGRRKMRRKRRKYI